MILLEHILLVHINARAAVRNWECEVMRIRLRIGMFYNILLVANPIAVCLICFFCVDFVRRPQYMGWRVP